MASAAADIAGILAGVPALADDGIDQRVLCNWGANDYWTDGAAWQANYLTIVDAIHAKWPLAKVYLMRPWMRGQDAAADALAVLVDAIVAARPGVAFTGPDERVFIKGADNGATNMLADGIHYTAAGNAACASAWLTTLGF